MKRDDRMSSLSQKAAKLLPALREHFRDGVREDDLLNALRAAGPDIAEAWDKRTLRNCLRELQRHRMVKLRHFITVVWWHAFGVVNVPGVQDGGAAADEDNEGGIEPAPDLSLARALRRPART